MRNGIPDAYSGSNYHFRHKAPEYKNRTSGFTFTRSSLVTVRSGKPFPFYFSAFSLLLIPALLLHLLASGQQKSRKQLEKERRENLRKIEQTREILQEVKKEKRSSITQLRAIEEQERMKEKTIGNIREELGILDSDMAHLQSEEEKLAYTLAVLKKEYAAMVYAASKAKKADFGFYLFASASAQQFFSRWQHLRHYASERRIQEKQIRELSLRLNQQKLKLAEVKQSKEVLLSQEQKERKQLQRLEEDKKQVVSQLSKKEQELKAKIKKHQEALRRLENLIASMVNKEIRKSRTGETSDKTKAAGSTSEMLLTPEGRLISSSFSGNRGRLPWPVQSGFISSGFGRQEHPVLKKVYIDNLGVDISTKAGAAVRTVFEGVVGLVGSVPGMDGQIVLIRHGDYFTVYSGLKNIRVSAGEKVKRMQAMGDVKSGEEGAVLQFQVWKNSKRLNPQSWLAPR